MLARNISNTYKQPQLEKCNKYIRMVNPILPGLLKSEPCQGRKKSPQAISDCITTMSWWRHVIAITSFGIQSIDSSFRGFVAKQPNKGTMLHVAFSTEETTISNNLDKIDWGLKKQLWGDEKVIVYRLISTFGIFFLPC